MSGRVGVEDLVEDGPAIHRLATRILGVDIGGAPLEVGLAVAGSEQEVSANVDRHRT